MTLTREQVLEMGAGGEMNSLIAEKVMNWYITKGEYSGKEYWNDSDDYSHYSVQGFNPSTHILAAWEVVEKMHDNQFLFDISTSVGAGYTARFYNRATEVYHNAHYIESAPLAICRAALLTTIGEGTE